MADNVNEQVPTSVETTDRGLFDFMKKKEDQKPQEETTSIASEFDQKVQVSEPEIKKEEEKKHGGLLEKLHRSDSSSSSSSDEERDDEEKKKKKKEKKEKEGLKEKLKEKLGGQHKDEEDTNVPIEKEKPHVQEVVYSEPSYPHKEEDHEKKGFIDKIKDKLPGQKKVEEQHESTAPVAIEPSSNDKKGFMDKIKEKIPGFSSKGSEEKKEHEEKKECH